MIPVASISVFALALPLLHTLTANVNDVRSHGSVGDQFLSLDEAIQLSNGTLFPSQLSLAERGQLVGTGTMPDEIVIDAAITPTITLERPLSDVLGLPPSHASHGLHVEGVATAAGAMPVLAGGSQQRILTLRTHAVHVAGLRFTGGQIAVDSRNATGSMLSHEDMAMVEECEFDGQTVAGVKASGAGTDSSMTMVMHCRFVNQAVGLLVLDQTTTGMLMLENEHCEFDGTALGCDILVNGTTGNMSMWMCFRSTFRNGAQFVRVRRGPGSSQPFMLRITHTDVVCSGDVADIQGTSAGLTMVHHHHSNFIAGAGGKAMHAWPRTAQFDLHGSEMVFDGDVSLAAGLFTQRLWQQNSEFRNGTLTLDNDGANPNLLWNRFQGYAIVVPASARTQLLLSSCELVQTNVSTQSLFAPITLNGCYRNGGTNTGQVNVNNPAPARFLATTTVTPADPQLGTTVALQASVPPGFGMLWDFTVSEPRPVTTREPVRFYGDPTTMVALPGMVVFQSRTDIPVPLQPALVGFELYVTGVTLPLLGQPWAPAYQLPRGGLIRPRV
jgi:hypothetical protein